jgi:nucleotide-binding universal stress UspA family protein
MIKIILVPLDGSERSADVLDTALVVANRFDAHIKAVHVRKQSGEPFMFSDVPAAFRKNLVDLNNQAVDAVVATVQQQFNDFCARSGVKKVRKPSTSNQVAASLEVLEGNPETVLSRESRLVDVIAMSRPARHRIGGAGVGELHEVLMLRSGRPVMVVPPLPEWQPHKVNHAAIGWNDSVEASRALSMTLPWLSQMKKVTVLVSKKREDSVEDVIRYLKRHGCKATHQVVTGRGSNVGKKMLETCKDVGAEFLVVGGFSHTRTRQRLFGGVTSHLLGNTDIITVMAH